MTCLPRCFVLVLVLYATVARCSGSARSPQHVTRGQDPDTWLDTASIIRNSGRPATFYTVTTEDGYKLPVTRLPRATGRPVLLMPGLACESTAWVVGDSARSVLAYALFDAGYDVWILNFRGHPYPSHVSLSPNDPRYWAFSFDEMAKYDLAAHLSFVLATTGAASVAAAIGHSQGGGVGFAAFSTYPALAKQVDLFVSLAGLAGPPSGPLLASFPPPSLFCPDCPDQWHAAGCCGGAFGLSFNTTAQRDLVRDCVAEGTWCPWQVCAMAGCESPANMNATRLPVMFAHWPNYVSAQTNAHLAQLVTGFKMYDYGSAAENRAHYGQATPPPYYLNNLNDIEVAVFYGSQDKLVTPAEVKGYVSLIPERLLVHVEELPWGHLDFQMALNAHELLFPTILSLLERNATLYKR